MNKRSITKRGARVIIHAFVLALGLIAANSLAGNNPVVAAPSISTFTVDYVMGGNRILNTVKDSAFSSTGETSDGEVEDHQDENLASAPDIVINEVDADQVSTDSAEFVELYDGGAGNTDLTGMVLVFFNGSNDASYEAFDLDGQSTDANGYFVLCGDAGNVPNCDLDVSPDTNLIQNGADAVALYLGDAVDYPDDTPVSTTDLIDAIVYDTDDSDDAGLLVLLNAAQPQVNERDGGDGTAHSNQRCPNGTGGARNTDTYAQFEPTSGAENTCTLPPDVILNEVDADQVNTDSAEFVELYDGGVGNTDLTGMSLVFFNGSNDASYEAFDLDGQSTDANGYFVLCGDAGNVPNCDLDVSPDSNLIQNGADAVALYLGDAVDYPDDTPVSTTDLIDAIVYDTDDSDDAGLLVLLNAAQPQVNERDGGDGTAHSNQRCPNGTGGARNTDTYAQFEPTSGAENTCTLPPDVILNEVDADQVNTDSAEFVELYDGGVGNTDLTGMSLVFFNGSNDASYEAFDLDGQSTDANGYFVLCGDAGNVPNCDLDVSPDTNLIQNGADAVALYLGDAVDFPEDTPVSTTDLIDAIVYDTDDSDDAGLLVLLNAGQPQVNERDGGDGTAHSNQRCPNGSGGARNTDTYSQFEPTSGAENTCGPPPDVIINEVDADQVSTDSAEFVELFDGGVGNTDLTGMVLVLFNGSIDASYGAFDLDGQSTDANGYFVLCGDAGNVPNCDLDVSPDTNLIQNGADAVALYLGDAVDFPEDTPVSTTDLIDAIVYDTDDSDDAGLLVLLNTAQPQVNERDGGDGTAHSNQRCPNGSGGARNTDTYAQFEPTSGAENTCGPPPDVIINEVDADQVSTDSAEFVELYDGGVGNTDLTGMSLVLFNGSDDASYGAFDLDGQSTDANGYFVLCGDAGNVPNCDLDVSPDTNLIQNGADAVALYLGDETDFPNGTTITTTNLLDAIVYDTNDGDDSGLLSLLNLGQPQINEDGGGDKDNHSNQRCPNGYGGSRNTFAYIQAFPTPGASSPCGSFGVCGNPATPIHVIQGNDFVSPMNGTPDVIIEGVVVGDFQETDQLRGFYVQEEDTDVDSDTATSEGVFIYQSTPTIDVTVGDVVRLLGDVTEYYNVTEINNVDALTVCEGIVGATASPAVLDLPVPDLLGFEQVEGMLVNFPDTLTASQNYFQGRYGQVTLSSDGRLYQPTNVLPPGSTAMMAMADQNMRRMIVLDDGTTAQNPSPIPYIGADDTLRAGDTVSGLTGVIDYGLITSGSETHYKVHPVQLVSFTRVNDRTAAPEPMDGTLKVASFNVLNYFNGDGLGGGFPTSRGADTMVEFIRQRTKIISAVLAIDADILGLMEIENDSPPNSAIEDLVDGLNAIAGAGTYDFIDTGIIGTDEIKVALIYKPGTVTPIGLYAVIDPVEYPLFNTDKNRPALAQTFAQNSNREVLTIAVNHLKSKGSDCNDVGDPDIGDGQGNCNITRTNAAIAIADWLAHNPTDFGDEDYLIIGDLNSYAMEDPITALEAAGYTNLVARDQGQWAYSYIFNGQSGYLDHALATSMLTDQVRGVTIWHINTDEPSVIDYNEEYKSVDLYTTTPYRASDHDPVVISLDLGNPLNFIYIPLVLK